MTLSSYIHPEKGELRLITGMPKYLRQVKRLLVLGADQVSYKICISMHVSETIALVARNENFRHKFGVLITFACQVTPLSCF